jgi:hypothetical protein
MQRSILAVRDVMARSTSEGAATVVSPGVVIANAPCDWQRF